MFRPLRFNSRDAGEIVLSAAAYLGKLNSEQRRAVEHGVGGAALGGPLLVIAGAGSGKTNTLAHRVAHLIVTGADPRRILLMTFSRRAAAEMCARVQRICKEALGDEADVLADALTWSGTFHGIGARLLREYAAQHRARSRFHHPRPRGLRRPAESGAPRPRPVQNGKALSRPRRPAWPSIPARSIPKRRWTRFSASISPGARAGARSCERCLQLMSRPSRRRTCSITTICCSIGRR